MISLLDRLRQLTLRKPHLIASSVSEILEKHKVSLWFYYAFIQWRHRWHVWRSILWIVRNLSPGARILETGAGCGWNLFWLEANGFSSLVGIDIDASAVAAGNDLVTRHQNRLNLRCDDALSPTTLGDQVFDVILALNWTYHVPAFDLTRFLQTYTCHLVPNGVIVMDLIDASFNAHPDNAYLTSDWKRPKSERAPSEYLHRFDEAGFQCIAASCGYCIIASFRRHGTIPRSLYVLQHG